MTGRKFAAANRPRQTKRRHALAGLVTRPVRMRVHGRDEERAFTTTAPAIVVRVAIHMCARRSWFGSSARS